MARKVCKRCSGQKMIHLDTCDFGPKSSVLDGECTCDKTKPPVSCWGGGVVGIKCPDCNGTGERQKRKNHEKE